MKTKQERVMRFDPFAGEEGAFYYTSQQQDPEHSLLEEPVSENVICKCSCHKICLNGVSASDTVKHIPDGQPDEKYGKGKSRKENRRSDANSRFITGRMPLLDSSLNSKLGTHCPSANAIIKHSSEKTSSRQAIVLPKASSPGKNKQVGNPSTENQMIGIGRWLPIPLPLRGQGWRIRKSSEFNTRQKVCQHSDCDKSLLDTINEI